MSGFFGTDAQITLQRLTLEKRALIDETPGLYSAGRFYGTDDPDRVGWDGIDAILREQGMLGLRMISPAQRSAYSPGLAERGFRFDTWDTMIAHRETIRPRIEAILAAGLPDGLALAPALTEAEGAATRRVQQFVSDAGIVPFPGALLIEAPGQASVIIADRDGNPVAFANGCFPHNRFSPHYRSAWVGLVAVDPKARGLGLGKIVNALAIRRMVEEFGAERVYELVSPSNETSRRMVEACGPTVDATLLCGSVVPDGAQRFTR